MGKSGVITVDNKENEVYHNVVVLYQAGMDLNDESVELMRKYHPQGERYYWILYYTYMSAHQPSNIGEIINHLEPHLPQNMQINRSTYFRWKEQALNAVEGILWGYEEESRRLLEHFRDTWVADV